MLRSAGRPEEYRKLTVDGSSSGSTPQTFGPFRVLHQLGAGTLGPVFRAHDPAEGRLVAVKAFRLDLTPERAAELAAALNALVARDLSHPSIAKPLAAGMEGATPWLAQSYVAAEALDGALRQYGPAPIAQVLMIVTHVAGALDFAAVEGVFHGSLHPRDVLVSPEETHIVDFGVSGALEQCNLRAPVRRPYTAPERVAGGPATRSADVFALAAIAFELLTGQQITGPDGASLGALPEIPGADAVALRAAFSAALATDPSTRPVTSLGFASDLKTALGTAGLRSTPAITSRRTRRVTPPDVVPTLPLEGPAEAAAEPAASTRGTAPSESPAADTPAVQKVDAPQPVMPSGDIAALLGIGQQQESRLSLDQIELYKAERQPPIAERNEAKEPPSPPRSPRVTPRLDVPSPEELRREPPAPSFEPHVRTPRSFTSLALLIVLLAVGIAAGFAGGWVWATRDDASDPARVPTGPATGAVSDSDSSATAAIPPEPTIETENVIGEPRLNPVEPEAKPVQPEPSPRAGRKVPAAARTSRSAASRAPAPQVSGRLLIRSTPAGAVVEIDGRRRGETPLALERLAFGSHSIVISRSGYVPERRQVTLTRGRPAQSLEVPLRDAPGGRRASRESAPAGSVGSVFVASRPTGARVLLDGREVGTTPLVVSEVRAGSHVVRLELDGYRVWTSSVRVVAGERNRVTASLEEVVR